MESLVITYHNILYFNSERHLSVRHAKKKIINLNLELHDICYYILLSGTTTFVADRVELVR